MLHEREASKWGGHVPGMCVVRNRVWGGHVCLDACYTRRMSQYVVSLLAERPEHELREIRGKARADVDRLLVEIDLMDQALAKQAQQAARRTPRSTRRASASGGTREMVLNTLGAAGGDTTSPAQVIAALREGGSTVKSGAIRNMIRRLVDEGEVVRVGEGAYKLPSRNGSTGESHTGPSENGASEPPFTAAQPQEGT